MKNSKGYVYDGNRLVKEVGGDKTIAYIYGTDGIKGIRYNGSSYFYFKNLQGDVIEIRDSQGTQVAEYSYDAYGNHKVFDAERNENTSSDFIGNINPIRYRSYYYDVETGLYYVFKRYYDAEIGRFISPDNIDNVNPLSINGLNLFACICPL